MNIKLKSQKLFFFLLSLIITFSACNPTRRVPENQYLLVSNTIKVDKQGVERESLRQVIKQKPNRKILGVFRFHLTMFNFVDPIKAKREKDKKIEKRKEKNKKRDAKGKSLKSMEFQTVREWLMNIGEAPVLLDSNQTLTSNKQLHLSLVKKGYFNNTVSDSTVFKNKKAHVIYSILTGIPYKLEKITYTIPDPKLAQYVVEDAKKASLFKLGENYDEETIIKERERIVKVLQNLGYFYFVKEFIHFKIDTSLGNKMVHIDLEIKNREVKLPENDSIVEAKHKQYYINDIYVYTAFNPRNPDKELPDTLLVNDFRFVYKNELKYKPNIITQRIFIKPGEYYQLKNLEETYKKMADLKSFKFINIQFKDEDNDPDNKLINCHIMLSPVVKQSFNFETEGTNRGVNLGIAGNIVYTNNNPFKGAENIEIRLRGGLESQQTSAQMEGVLDDIDPNLVFFNTKEFGPEITLNIPKFLLPIRPERFSKYFTPKTTITSSYNYQDRPDLTRRIINFSFGYNWKESPTKTHFVFPADINIVNINPKPTLADFFETLNNPFIERSFTPHATIGSRYTFIYNNQIQKQRGKFMYFRGSVEGAGNLLRLGYKLAQADTNEFGSYEIIPGTPFSQYVKLDADFRFYKILNPKSNYVARTAIGIGKPLSNLNVLPLEKSYFGGGSNSIRAWAARSLGPGSYNDTSSFNTLRIGDISLEANLEYRFDIYKFFEGAFFVDAGNIWLFNEDPDRPGGNFEFNRFLDQIAIGTGMGLRLDFSFFVFRLDLGIKVRDPMIIGQDKWVITHILDKQWKQDNLSFNQGRRYFTNLNFGIGYPF
ncbi:MAG: BamA/TamA family outer membrane protein [Bacteroidetes bacterium]|nr:BamA/TamA family outer membrane protein [Bacteroidota bacterium]